MTSIKCKKKEGKCVKKVAEKVVIYMDQLRKTRDNEVDKQKVKVTCKKESETKSESTICRKEKRKTK